MTLEVPCQTGELILTALDTLKLSNLLVILMVGLFDFKKKVFIRLNLTITNYLCVVDTILFVKNAR